MTQSAIAMALMALFLIFPAQASEKKMNASDFSVTTKLVGTELRIQATPPKGLHFNIQAPIFLQVKERKFKPAAATEKQVRFKIPAEKSITFTTSIYLCDDQKTFCENHRVVTTWNSGSSTSSSAPASKTPSGENRRTDADTHGFIINEPDIALARAKKENKPLLIDFFGIWCPPCNMLDEKVFSSREFREASGKFIRLKLDADSDISWALKSRFSVGGYPTVVFASAEGEEISRVVGYRPKKEFVREIESAWKNRDNAFSALKQKAAQGDTLAAERVGLIFLERREFAEAFRYLKGIEKCREERAEAEIGLLEGKATPESRIALITALEHSIRDFPSSPGSVLRRMKLARLYETANVVDKKKPLLESAISTARSLVDRPEKLAGKDFTVADLWSIIADLYEELGDPVQAKRSWKSAAAEYKKGATSDRERGNNLELAHCLWKSGDTKKAERLYEKLEKNYPREFTFYYGHASMMLALKNFPETERLASRAYEFSYGDNRLRAAHLLARALKEQGKTKESDALIKRTIDSVTLPADEKVRTHQYLAALRKLQSAE